jgi:tungstate transport system substrate-binding protein
MAAGRRVRRLALLLMFPLVVELSACRPKPSTLRVATTTSVENSGLLAAILPAFERQHHITVEVLPVGSGQALDLLKRGDVTVGLTHDPKAEASARASGIITDYRKIMFNDFILVGPREDPAGIAHAPDAVEAMRRIAAKGAVFVSRGDASGTYAREQELWALAQQSPPRDQLLETGQGMSPTLRVASEKRAYTLTDRATFEQLRSGFQLTSLFEGGPALLNTYAIFLRAGLTGADRQDGATLADWFADGEGRQLVARYLVNGRAVFKIWPAGFPRDQPTDLPDAR